MLLKTLAVFLLSIQYWLQPLVCVRVQFNADGSLSEVSDNVESPDSSSSDPPKEESIYDGVAQYFPVKMRNWSGESVVVWLFNDDGKREFVANLEATKVGTIMVERGYKFVITTGTAEEHAKGEERPLIRFQTYPFQNEIPIMPHSFIQDKMANDRDYFVRRGKFMKEYWLANNKEKTWINYYPIEPITSFMYAFSEENVTISSNFDYIDFNKIVEDAIALDTADNISPIVQSLISARKDGGTHPTTPIDITIESKCASPGLFYIHNLLSDHEADFIRTLADNGFVTMSDEHEHTAQTGAQGWIRRKPNSIIDYLSHRFADVLQMDESRLQWVTGAEDMKLVHYTSPNGEYTTHHDFKPAMQPQNRYLSLLMYLNDVSPGDGGETQYFGEDCNAKIGPKRGDAVLMYNILADGNLDEQSMHAGLPVTNGDKWIAVLWVWEPVKPVDQNVCSECDEEESDAEMEMESEKECGSEQCHAEL